MIWRSSETPTRFPFRFSHRLDALPHQVPSAELPANLLGTRFSKRDAKEFRVPTNDRNQTFCNEPNARVYGLHIYPDGAPTL